jgi:hypothetical protein
MNGTLALPQHCDVEEILKAALPLPFWSTTAQPNRALAYGHP